MTCVARILESGDFLNIMSQIWFSPVNFSTITQITIVYNRDELKSIFERMTTHNLKHDVISLCVNMCEVIFLIISFFLYIFASQFKATRLHYSLAKKQVWAFFFPENKLFLGRTCVLNFSHMFLNPEVDVCRCGHTRGHTQRHRCYDLL